jgi:hypothetical protein
MRFKTAILCCAAALMLSTGLAGAALADTPKPTPVPPAKPTPRPVPPTGVCRPPAAKPAPCPPVAVPRPALPTYTG